MDKLCIKLALAIIVIISFGFSQVAKKEGNLIKLDDGRVIEVDLQTLEDYFFFEIDNPEAVSDPIQEESLEYQSGFETTNENDSDNNNANEIKVDDSSFNLPEQRSLNESTTNLNSVPNSEKTLNSSPTLKSETQISPHIKDRNGNYFHNRSQLSFRLLKNFPDDRLPAQFNASGERQYTPTLFYNQSLRTPNNNSERAKFDSKTSRENIAPSQSLEDFDPDLNQDSSFDDTYSPFKNPDNNVPKDNINEEPINNLLPPNNNESSANNFNNQVTINLYNLTNLLDQVFSKNNPQRKKEELRTAEWENAYKKILEQDALALVDRDNNSANQDAQLREFIVKLPLLYVLLYGEERILPPDKNIGTEPFDVKPDDEEYYNKSVVLLENILKTFPDINKNNVKVVVISNFVVKDGIDKSTQDNIDQRYQREVNTLRKKYNYNIGLELVQIKKLFSQQQYTLVLKKLHQLEKEEPYNTRIKNIIGSTYYKIGFNEFAQRYWEESLNLDPNQPLVEAFLDRIRQYGDNPATDIPTER